MGYNLAIESNGIELTYWKITQRNQCSAARVDWATELSGYVTKTDRDAGHNPLMSQIINFSSDDHPITEAETEAAIQENRDFADSDAFAKHVLYTHITRIANIAHAKAEDERSESEEACLFFYGAVEA